MSVVFHEPIAEAHYKSLSHRQAKPNPNRDRVFRDAINRYETDGLVDLKYRRLKFQLKPTYTHILIDISNNVVKDNK